MKALFTNGDSVQSALLSAQAQLKIHCQYDASQVEQHAQWTHSNIPTLALEADVEHAGGRRTLLNQPPPPEIVEIQRHMEAVRKG